jgi:hypothetical protein
MGARNLQCIACRLKRPSITQPDDDSIRHIALPGGLVAVVDASDYEYLMQWNWCAQARLRDGEGSFYVARKDSSGKKYMHRIITAAPEGMDVDHINHDGLDNRRHNLRVVTRSVNLMNQLPTGRNTSGTIGVYWHKASGKWMAAAAGKYLGLFAEKSDAAGARAKYEELFR